MSCIPQVPYRPQTSGNSVRCYVSKSLSTCLSKHKYLQADMGRVGRGGRNQSPVWVPECQTGQRVSYCGLTPVKCYLIFIWAEPRYLSSLVPEQAQSYRVQYFPVLGKLFHAEMAHIKSLRCCSRKDSDVA